jgi:5-methyltetrahydropteroyltriglutamate--homocysteine methyltransferase
MPIATTTIGSYPKPDYVPLPDWYHAKSEEERGVHPTDPTRLYADFERRRSERDDALLDQGTQEVVREQDALGIDVPTDGEVRRDHYVFYHLRQLAGFDFDHLTEREMRAGGWSARVPTVTGRIAHRERFLRHDWQVAQAATRKPVKMTVPGPLTIAGSTADAFYGDERALCADLGDALNVEIRDLAAAGCPWIQIDEPLFARHPDKALAFGIDNLARCLHRLPEETRTAVHVCCGYPAELDQADYPKADPAAYLEIADALDAAPVDAVSLEDAHRPNDLALLERYRQTTVILGVLDIASSERESAEAIRARLSAALEHIDPHRLMAGPDCGLTMLPRRLAREKLQAMVQAARAV